MLADPLLSDHLILENCTILDLLLKVKSQYHIEFAQSKTNTRYNTESGIHGPPRMSKAWATHRRHESTLTSKGERQPF